MDGIIVRDSSFWNTLPYRSDRVTIKNYKLINCRPNSGYNNTDGVDFDESTNGYLYNAFLYTGDDNMAVKNEYDNAGTINTKNIVHEKIVLYSNSAGCKIGTKTMGRSMDQIVFRDIDVVKAGRATVVDAYDTAVISNTRFENVRIEDAGSIIALEENDPPSWRKCSNKCIIKDTYFTNFSSNVKSAVNLHGKDSSYNVNGVYFSNFSVKGNPVTSRTDSDASWNINSYVSNITFTQTPQTLVGDLNGDRSVDAADYALMKMYLLGSIKDFPVENDIAAGDLNLDGTIDPLDFAVLKKYLLGTISKLPYSI